MKRFSVVMLFLQACFFLSCGLDTTNFVESPTSTGHTVNYTTADRAEHYFSFKTSEDYSSSSFRFDGTDVFYKIYTDASTMNSVRTSISSMNEASQGSSLVNTYGYKSLKLGNTATPSPLISATGSDRYVYVRLSDYNSGEYQAAICVGSTLISSYNSSYFLGSPRRFINSSYGFDFGKNSSNPLPSSSDADFRSGSFTESGTYYIDAYAVGVGTDTTTLTRSYSSVLYLGSIPVKTSYF